MDRVEEGSQYYTSLASMQRKFDKYARKQPLRADSLEAYRDWAQVSRAQLWKLLGLDKMEDCELEAGLLETIEVEGKMKREKMLIQVEPQIYMPFYILYPKKEDQVYIGDGDNKKPACVIAVKGHQSSGKESVYGLKLAQKGYIAITPDVRGFGERRELAFQKELAFQRDEEDNSIAGICCQLSHMAEPLGMTVMGMFVYDLMRLVDYIYERGDFDVSQLGCVGFSEGGMQTLMTAALDERLQKLIISGYMYGYKDSLLLLNGSCNCNYVPHLWEYFDMGDIGALLAPREVIIQSCKEDHQNGPRGLENVYEQLEIMNQAYLVNQAQTALRVDIREGGQCFHSQVLNLY